MITATRSLLDQAMTPEMTSLEHSLPSVLHCASRAEFHAWLARAKPGEQLEYHRGLLTWDRSPASGHADGDRRALGKVADAVFRAAADGCVHLVQRRHGPFDFSYLAIKAGRAATAGAGALPPIEQALAA
jgi:hypothetical protein